MSHKLHISEVIVGQNLVLNNENNTTYKMKWGSTQYYIMSRHFCDVILPLDTYRFRSHAFQ
jgi:hypothetical protein